MARSYAKACAHLRYYVRRLRSVYRGAQCYLFFGFQDNCDFCAAHGSSRMHSSCFSVPAFPNLFPLPSPFKRSTLKADSHYGCAHGTLTVKANVLVPYIDAAAVERTVPVT